MLIWGAGGHGRVVADAAASAHYAVVGFVDRDAAHLGSAPASGFPPVTMSEADLLARLADETGDLPMIALGIGDNRIRLHAADQLRSKCATPIIHPAASVSASTSIGPGSVVLARAVINPGARVGRAVIVNSGAIIEHDCELGDGVHVSPGAILTGSVTVGARGWIGAGAVVIPGISIGADAIVGAGAVVIRDVPPRTTVAGNPARPIQSTT